MKVSYFKEQPGSTQALFEYTNPARSNTGCRNLADSGKDRPPANTSFKVVGLEASAGKFDSHSRLDWTFGLAVTGAIKARMSQLTTPPRTFVGDELRARMAGTACAVGGEGGEVGRMFFLVVEIGAEFFSFV